MAIVVDQFLSPIVDILQNIETLHFYLLCLYVTGNFPPCDLGISRKNLLLRGMTGTIK